MLHCAFRKRRPAVEKVVIRFTIAGRRGRSWTAAIEPAQKAVLAEIRRNGNLSQWERRALNVEALSDDCDQWKEGRVYIGLGLAGSFGPAEEQTN